ncbi:MAG: DUF4332 domain-containing protein [Planctomycetota bacterium]
MFALFAAWQSRRIRVSRVSTDMPSAPTPVGRHAVTPTTSHRERLLAMRIQHLQLCSEKRASQLADVGIRTAGDLLWCQPERIAGSFRAPARACRAIRRFQSAIGLAVAVEGMTPRDAMLLIAIHRRSVDSLAGEHAATLRRDLERFSLSTQGTRLVGNRGIPSLRRIKAWIAECQTEVQQWTAAPVPNSSVAA